MNIEQSITIEKGQVLAMLKDKGVAIPADAALSVSTTKDGQRLIVKWMVKP